MNSKRKGTAGEREAAAWFTDHGWTAKRGQQRSGLEVADIIGVPGLHIEVKRVDKLNIHKALAQSIRDAKSGEKPIVFHRRDYGEWLVTMRAEDWIELYNEWQAELYLQERRNNASDI